MKKLFIIFTLSTMLISVMASCAVPTKQESFTPTEQKVSKEYGVFINQTLNSAYFTEDTREFVWQGQQGADNSAPNELTKTEKVNGQDVTVAYDWTFTTSLGDTRHYYKSADQKVECVYRAKDMSLASIKLYGQDMSVFADMGQEEYDQYIRNYVSQYQAENWADLPLSCFTHYEIESEDYWESAVKPGFLTEFAANVTLHTREFQYTKQYGGYRTTDEVNVMVSIAEESIRIWFNDHRFDSLDITIDHNAIDTAISDFLNDYLREGVALESYEQWGAKLMYSKDNLLCMVDINAVFSRDGVREEQYLSFIVDIPDSN